MTKSQTFMIDHVKQTKPKGSKTGQIEIEYRSFRGSFDRQAIKYSK